MSKNKVNKNWLHGHINDPYVKLAQKEGFRARAAFKLQEIDASLNAHGLIKIRVLGDDRDARVSHYESICADLGAAPVQHIGKLLVVYRPKKELTKEVKTTRGKGLREVVIVKTNPTKKPTITKVMVKGNERVTAGGNIKRAKTRQTSKKKRALGG